MEFYYYIFEIKYYDDGNDYKEREERGVICASSKADIIEKLEQWFGKNNIYDIRIYDVNMDTNEILFENNFPGLIELLENPVEGY